MLSNNITRVKKLSYKSDYTIHEVQKHALSSNLFLIEVLIFKEKCEFKINSNFMFLK